MQVGRGRAPAAGAGRQRGEGQGVAAVIERQLAPAQLRQPVHALNVARAFLDHRHIRHVAPDAHDQLGRHVDTAGGRVVVQHDRNTHGIADARHVAHDFFFAQFPVRHRQDHHRVGALLFRIAGTAHGASRGQVGNTHHRGHPSGDGGQRGGGHGIPLPVLQVGALARAAQRGDAVHAVGDQALDQLLQAWQVDIAASGRERGDRVGNDALK